MLTFNDLRIKRQPKDTFILEFLQLQSLPDSEKESDFDQHVATVSDSTMALPPIRPAFYQILIIKNKLDSAWLKAYLGMGHVHEIRILEF